MVVRSVVTKWDKHQIETVHSEFCKKISSVYNVKHQIMHAESTIMTIPANYQNTEKSNSILQPPKRKQIVDNVQTQ